MFPRFLGIGAQKAGTTWLHEMLSSHTEIWLPHLKELHYFDRKFPINDADPTSVSAPSRNVRSTYMSTRLRRINAAKLKERLSIRRWPDLIWEIRYIFGDWSDDWYSSLFENVSGRLPGEITPAYSCLSESAVSYVHNLMPDTKLILLLRNPVDRAWSHARMDVARAKGRPIDTISAMEYFAHFNSFASRRRGDYLGSIRRWLTDFPERQFFLGFFDEIQSCPEDLLTRIFQFLGVSANEGDIPRSVRRRVNAGAEEPIPAQLHRYLAQLYVDDIRELAKQYGRYPQQWLINCQRALDTAPVAT